MSGTINFNYYTPTKEPGVYIEVNEAGTATGTGNNVLIFGQILSSGTLDHAANLNMPVLAVNQQNVNTLTGAGSMLANLYQYAVLNNPSATFYICPVSGTGGSLNGGMVANQQTITITGAPTSAGVIALYISGFKIPVNVTTTMTATQVGVAMAQAINANVLVPVTATAAAGVVTVTTQSPGITAGDTPIVFNYLGASNGEYPVPGLTFVVAQSVAPSGDPDLATPLANCANLTIDTIINPYVGTADISEIDTWLGELTGRWQPSNDQYGVVVTARRGIVTGSDNGVADLVNFGSGSSSPNCQFLSVAGVGANWIQPAYLYAAAFAGSVSYGNAVNVARPYNGQPLLGILAPPVGQSFNKATRSTLLNAGISTLKTSGSSVLIDRAITTYTTNALALPDSSWLNLNVPYQLAYVSRYLQTGISNAFQQKILVSNGTQINAGNNFVTPNIIASYADALYADLCALGICQNAGAVASGTLSNDAGGGVVQLYIPVQLASQLEIIAINLTFSQP